MRKTKRIIDPELTLVPYYPNERAALPWYQDPQLCKQVDDRDGVYDLPLLRAMYRYLDRHGDLYYIKYRRRLCGDVCLHPDGEINIVVAAPWQNQHIGRRVIGELISIAREKGIPPLRAEIYAFNTQSQAMFRRCGFHPVDETHWELDV